jgi:hypothetical protein
MLAKYHAIIVSSENVRICAPTALGKAKRGEQHFRCLYEAAEIDRVAGNENETKNLQRQVDSLVELLGHHGVRLDARPLSAAREPLGPGPLPVPVSQIPAQTISTDMPVSYPPPQLSMVQPPLSGSGQPDYVDTNQYFQEQVEGEPWSHSSADPLVDGTAKALGHSPSNEPSHGTLVISASGRSKYLGPSAASEWLKDVCTVGEREMTDKISKK